MQSRECLSVKFYHKELSVKIIIAHPSEFLVTTYTQSTGRVFWNFTSMLFLWKGFATLQRQLYS